MIKKAQINFLWILDVLLSKIELTFIGSQYEQLGAKDGG